MRTERSQEIEVTGGAATRLVGKAKLACLLAAIAATLAGCGAPGPVAAGEPESRVGFKKVGARSATAPAAPKAQGAAKAVPATVRGPAAGGVAPAGARPGAIPVVGGAIPAVGGAIPVVGGGPLADGAAGAGATDDAAAVAIVAAPSAAVRMFPLLAGDELQDARFAPADGTLEWTLRAPKGGVRLAKAAILIEGGAAPVTAEGPPADFGLPAEFTGETKVRATFALVDTMEALAGAITATELRGTYTFTDVDGHVVAGPDGAPLALTARIAVQ